MEVLIQTWGLSMHQVREQRARVQSFKNTALDSLHSSQTLVDECKFADQTNKVDDEYKISIEYVRNKSSPKFEMFIVSSV